MPDSGVNKLDFHGEILNKFNNLEAVIWDMDGVIVDSGPQHFKSWHITLKQYSKEVSDEQLRRLFGMTSPEVARILFGAHVAEKFVIQLCEEKEFHFREAIRETARYLPGVKRWLHEFKRCGVRQAIASSGSQENIDAVLDALNARGFFEEIISGKNMPSKPDPAVFLQAAQQLSAEPANCLVIEDAIAGVAGAKAAGMKCLAVATTNHPHDLKDADAVLLDLEALSDAFLNKLLH